MTLRLAYDAIELRHDNLVVVLRPSLRAGLLIAQKYSVEELRDHLGQCHFGVIAYLIALGTNDVERAADFTAAVLKSGYRHFVPFVPALVQFATISLGIDTEPSDKATPITGEPVPFTVALTELFEFAAGALQWSADQAWAATPAEIIAARKGHFALLRAIHGSAEDKSTSPADDIPDLDQVRANIAGLREKLGSAL